MDALSEFDLVHPDGDEFVPWVVEAGGDPGDFVDPLEQVAAEEEAVVVEMFWQDELVVFHGRLFLMDCTLIAGRVKVTLHFLKSTDPQPKKTSRIWQANFPFAPAKVPFFYGWVIMAVSTLAIVFSIPGQTMGFTVFTEVLMEQLELSRVKLSSAFCLGTILSGFSLPSLGRLFDRIGARRMVVYSSLATAAVLFYLSQSRRILDATPAFIDRTVAAFFIITLGFYLIRASAQGVLTMSARNAIGKWFDYNRGKALAVSGVAVAFGFASGADGDAEVDHVVYMEWGVGRSRDRDDSGDGGARVVAHPG